MNNPPIFLRPMGRTGGTLFVTMLDAHPQIAMSYEIYQDRLLSDTRKPIDILWAIDILQQTSEADGFKWVKKIPDKNFRTFVARARRADVEVNELLQELRKFYQIGGSFEKLSDRLDFIERLMIFKMYKVSKQYWGGKAATIKPEELHQRHPNARFFAMIRDGRDVLASQLNVGNFQTNVLTCAQQWRQGILDFRKFKQCSEVSAMEIHYETLVSTPEVVMQKVCQFISVDYDQSLLNFHTQEMALFKNPHGHLSYKQIARGLNKQSIGRWKNDLSTEDIKIFEEVNRDLLIEYGYL